MRFPEAIELYVLTPDCRRSSAHRLGTKSRRKQLPHVLRGSSNSQGQRIRNLFPLYNPQGRARGQAIARSNRIHDVEPRRYQFDRLMGATRQERTAAIGNHHPLRAALLQFGDTRLQFRIGLQLAAYGPAKLFAIGLNQ